MKKLSPERVKGLLEVVLAALGALLGGNDALVSALLGLMALDYVSGVMGAFVSKKLSSDAGFKGIFKKALLLMTVGAAALIDRKVLGAGGALRGAVIGFYISNEALSLLENAAALGLPVPKKLKDALKQLRSNGEN